MKSNVNRICKRVFDILFSLLALLVLSPMMLIVSAMVFLSDKGPILYKSRRAGRNGVPFDMLKFRTMYANKDKSPVITLRTDRRIFPFGRFLRKTKIDELPQLINILAGNMSIVGPRPEDPDIAKALYIGKYRHILDILPGLTSYGSLYDYTVGETYTDEDEYSRIILPKKLGMELFYVNNMSPAIDCKLIALTVVTVFAVFFGKTDFRQPAEIEEILFQDSECEDEH